MEIRTAVVDQCRTLVIVSGCYGNDFTWLVCKGGWFSSFIFTLRDWLGHRIKNVVMERVLEFYSEGKAIYFAHL